MMTEDELIEAVLAAPLSDAGRISKLQDCVELMSRIAQTGGGSCSEHGLSVLERPRTVLHIGRLVSKPKRKWEQG